MSNTGLKCIHREEIDGRNAFVGYRVKVQWRGRVLRRRFSDRGNGGKRHTLKVALEWRDRSEAELRKPRTEAWIRSSGAWGRGARTGMWNR